MPISSYDLKSFTYNRYFVECGSAGLGMGIRSALIAGFEKVYSVEISPAGYAECAKIFANEQRVDLTFGDCTIWLSDILDKLNEPCTIYLDANGWREEKSDPFVGSVEAILRNGRKDHTILVDDMNHGGDPFDNVLAGLLSKTSGIGSQLRRINNNYNLSIIDTHTEDMSHTFKAWVAVAKP